MTSTAPNENVKDNLKDQISCKLVSEIIRERIQAKGARFHANDNISDFIQPGELETLEREVATRLMLIMTTTLKRLQNVFPECISMKYSKADTTLNLK